MLTLSRPGNAEQTINKSRFIATAKRCDTEREVAALLRGMATEYHNASHLAYAYRVKTPNGIVARFSDAGEPSGTAGKPILQMLEARDLINIGVGVIRYYGGINLGTGGLARAYGGTAKEALENGQIVPFVEMQELQLNVDYKRLDELIRAVSQHEGTVLDKTFGESVQVKISLPAQQSQTLLNRFS